MPGVINVTLSKHPLPNAPEYGTSIATFKYKGDHDELWVAWTHNGSGTHPNKESQSFYVFKTKRAPRCCRQFSPLSSTKEIWLWIPTSTHSVSSGPFYSVYPYQASLQTLSRPNHHIPSPRLLSQLWDLEVLSGSPNNCMQGPARLHLLLPRLSQPISLVHVPIPKISNFGRLRIRRWIKGSTLRSL